MQMVQGAAPGDLASRKGARTDLCGNGPRRQPPTLRRSAAHGLPPAATSHAHASGAYAPQVTLVDAHALLCEEIHAHQLSGARPPPAFEGWEDMAIYANVLHYVLMLPRGLISRLFGMHLMLDCLHLNEHAATLLVEPIVQALEPLLARGKEGDAHVACMHA